MFSKLVASVLLICLFIGSQTFAQKKSEQRGIFEGKRSEVDMSNYQITLNLQDGLASITSTLEWKIDSILFREQNPAVKNNLIFLKYNLIQTLSRSAFYADPILSMMDTWALSYQLIAYFESESSGTLYHGHQQVIAKTLSRYLAGYEMVMTKYLSTQSREQLKNFAKNNPIHNENLQRKTVVPYLSAWLGEEEFKLKSGLLTMTDLLRDMSFRMHYYSEMLPKQTMWQMESSLYKFMPPDSLSSLVYSMKSLMHTSNDALKNAETLINYNRDTLLANLDYQRRVSLLMIQHERIAAMNTISQERAIVLEAITQERKAIEAFASSERKAAMKDMQVMGGDALKASALVGKELIDYIFFKIIILILVLGLIVLAGIYLSKRKTTPR